MKNNNLYEEMEVPWGLGSRANLSCEKDMKLNNGQINQGFCFGFFFVLFSTLLKNKESDKKEIRSKGLTFKKGLLVVNIPKKLLNSLSL